MYLHILSFNFACKIDLPWIYALVTYMYIDCMHCILTRTHEDMLFYRGECVTHWEIQVFLGFQVNWCHLGNQVSLTYIICSKFFGSACKHHTSYGTNGCRVYP